MGENPEEVKNPNSFQNVSYSLNGFGTDISLAELNDIIYNWIKKQKK